LWLRCDRVFSGHGKSYELANGKEVRELIWVKDAGIGAVGKLGDVCPFKLDNGFFDLGFSQLFSLVQ
jgi:hypothetical protein